MPRPPPASVDHVAVARLDAIATNRATVAQAGGIAVALFVVDGQVHAIDDSCLRCGASLGAGERRDGRAICVRCGWVYDIATGAVEGVPALRVRRYDVDIDDAVVRIAIPLRVHEAD